MSGIRGHGPVTGRGPAGGDRRRLGSGQAAVRQRPPGGAQSEDLPSLGAGLAGNVLVPVVPVSKKWTEQDLPRRARRTLFSFSFSFKYLQKERKKERRGCSGCSSCSSQEPYSYIVGSAERCRASRQNSFPRGLLAFKNRPGKGRGKGRLRRGGTGTREKSERFPQYKTMVPDWNNWNNWNRVG